MNQFDPNLAVDLAKVKEDQAVDLSSEAVEHRARQKRLLAAASWVATMSRAFRGIAGAPTRRQYVQIAIDKFDLR